MLVQYEKSARGFPVGGKSSAARCWAIALADEIAGRMAWKEGVSAREYWRFSIQIDSRGFTHQACNGGDEGLHSVGIGRVFGVGALELKCDARAWSTVPFISLLFRVWTFFSIDPTNYSIMDEGRTRSVARFCDLYGSWKEGKVNCTAQLNFN